MTLYQNPDVIEVKSRDLQCGDELVEYKNSSTGNVWKRWRDLAPHEVFMHEWVTWGSGAAIKAFKRTSIVTSTSDSDTDWRIRRHGPLQVTAVSDLQPGDVVFGFWSDLGKGLEFIHWDFDRPETILGWAQSRKHGREVLLGDRANDPEGFHMTTRDCKNEYLIQRKASVFGLKQAPAAPTSSPWNGRCVKCGRGTYTGLFNTDHEGGPCA